MNGVPKPSMLFALVLVLLTQAAWCAVLPSIDTPSPLNDNSIPSTDDWNSALQGVTNYINNSIVAPFNTATTKGDSYSLRDTGLSAFGVGANNTMLVADDTQAAGVKWSATGTMDVATTKGDMTAATGATVVRVAIGADNTNLTADSTATPGVAWANTASAIPTGVVVPWSPTGAGTTTIPTGWLVCDGTNSTPNLIGLFVIGTRTNGSSATPAPGGYGAHTADTANGAATHTHGASGSPSFNTTTTIASKVSGGGVSIAYPGHYHIIGGPYGGNFTAGCASATSEPSDYALIYLVKQ